MTIDPDFRDRIARQHEACERYGKTGYGFNTAKDIWVVAGEPDAGTGQPIDANLARLLLWPWEPLVEAYMAALECIAETGCTAKEAVAWVKQEQPRQDGRPVLPTGAAEVEP